MDRSFAFFDRPNTPATLQRPLPPPLLPRDNMQSQHLHLQSVDSHHHDSTAAATAAAAASISHLSSSQQMHPRQQQPLPPHPQHQHQQTQHHHQFQIHQLQHPQQSHHHHQQQQHHQQHQQHQSQQHSQSHHHQQQHLQPQSQSQQQHHHQQQHPHHHQPTASHSQHHLTALHLPHSSSQPGSLALNTNTNSPNFPVSSTLNHTNSQFAAQALSRDNLQPLQQQQQSQHSHFPLQSHTNLSQPPLHHQNPGPTNNSFASAVQPLQMQPILPSQQPSQAAFGGLANLSGSMLQAGVVDDTPTNAHQFANSQSGDALTSAYPWDPAHPAHGALASQNLTAANQTQQQQPLIPLPLVGDTRTNNALSNAASNQAFPGQNVSGQNSFGGPLNTNMGVLGSSLNTTMVSGLVNGNTLAPNVANVPPSLSPSGTDLSQRNSFSISDGGIQRATKTAKKGRGAMAARKTAPSRARNARGPITSPVSTATLPNVNQPPGVATNAPIDGNPAVPNAGAAVGNIANSPIHAARPARGAAGGKAKGRMRGPARGMNGSDMRGPGAMSSSTSVGLVVPNQPREDPGPGSTTGAMPGTLAPQNFGDAKNATSATVAWSTSKKASTSRSRSRRKGDGTTTSLPVHLRNPKKGRARVFRECKACRHENHIRRSDCSNCKAPLPAGKRRRDGNPSYDTKRQAAAAAAAVPNTHVVSQPVGRGRAAVKDDIAVPSVMLTK